jgi:Zn-dependent peptidase ImmA (M78 family)/transcriptional regulator with XRE-family HTH domain
MIVTARESRGYTQKSVSETIGLSQGTLSKIENGQSDPSGELVERIADALNYPASLLYRDFPLLHLPPLFFRKRVSVSATVLKAAQARMNLSRLHLSMLLRSAEFADASIPSIDLAEFRGDVEGVARQLRAEWRLPRGPVENVTKLLEDAGVVVFRCEFGTRKLDAISIQKHGDLPPMVFVNANMPGDRLRFTLAHELGHLVLHHHVPMPGAMIEHEANRFAAELLTPASEIRGFLSRPTIERLASLKPYWKVSISSLAMRAEELRQIGERQSRHLRMQLARAGYSDQEPFPIPTEEPRLVRELIDLHKGQLGYADTDLATALDLNVHEFRTLYGDGRPTLRVLNSG